MSNPLFQSPTPAPLTARYLGDGNAFHVEYHIHTWSQNGAHIASLRTPLPYAIPIEVTGETFNDFINNLYHDERDFGFITTLTWS
jgi:hypothetical protein